MEEEKNQIGLMFRPAKLPMICNMSCDARGARSSTRPGSEALPFTHLPTQLGALTDEKLLLSSRFIEYLGTHVLAPLAFRAKEKDEAQIASNAMRCVDNNAKKESKTKIYMNGIIRRKSLTTYALARSLIQM